MHEITASPFAFTYCRIWIFIQTGSVKFFQSIIIDCKMYRNKIHDHTNSCLVTLIHKFFQLIRCSITCGRRKKSGILISPGSIKRMLGKWHHLNMSIMILFYIRNQKLCKLNISIPVCMPFSFFSPGSCMDLVDIDRTVKSDCPVLHPFFILKFITIKIR